MTAKLSPVEFLAHVLTPEKQTDHVCWKCKYLKWVLKDSKFPPADIIGWCKKNPLAPLLGDIPDTDVITKCYALKSNL